MASDSGRPDQGDAGARWAECWRACLTKLADPARLSQGRWHVRSGRVVRLDIWEGGAGARLQGGQAVPRSVTLRLRPLSAAQWQRVEDALAASAHYAATLLNDELPDDIDAAFAMAGAELLPCRPADVGFTCSCSDARNGPCKHSIAAWYALGERLEADPTLLLILRGRSKEAVLAGLRRRWDGAEAPAAQPSPTDAEQFWSAPGGRGTRDGAQTARPAPVDGSPAAPRLEPPSFWPDGTDFEETLRAAYRALHDHAAGLLRGGS